MDSLLFRGGSAFLSYLGLQLIRQGPRILGRTICFTQSTDLTSNLTKNTLTDTPKILFDQISGHRLGPVRLTHELNHHSVHGCLKYTQWILMSEEGFMEEGSKKCAGRQRGSRSPGLQESRPPRHLGHSEQQAPLTGPAPLGRPWGWGELSLHTPPPARPEFACLALPRPHLEHISPRTQLAGGGYIFHGERARETAC